VVLWGGAVSYERGTPVKWRAGLGDLQDDPKHEDPQGWLDHGRPQRVPSFGFRDSGFGFRVSGFEFRVSCFVFLVSGFGFRVSSFKFRVSGLDFRFSAFVLRRLRFGVEG